MDIRNQSNYMETHQDYEVPYGISMTIPEQTLSLKDLILKHSRGQETIKYKGVYANLNHEDLDLSKFNRYDPVDRAKIAKAYHDKVTELENDILAKRKTKDPRVKDPDKDPQPDPQPDPIK